MSSQRNAAIDADAERLIGMFKDLHQNPELGFMEVRTASIVARELEALGYEVKTGIGQTGVVGILRNGKGPVVMYRADMDCNAVREATGLPYASTKTAKRKDASGQDEEVPVGHMCGHDAHTTWLLGVAKVMANATADWQGTLVLVAQPAEELGQGAQAMVHDGMYEKGVPKPEYLIGMHTAPIPTGVVACTAGELMAGTDQLDVTFHGIGGHGSSPHLTRDPILMACAAVVQYQFIVSRGIDPLRAAVVTVGSVQAGTDNNVIPSSALLKLNLRWFNEEDRSTMLAAIERINQSIASAYNLPEELYPTTVMKGSAKVLANDAEMAATVRPALQALLGERAVLTEAPKVMGSEDFPHLVIENARHRYLFLLVGTAKPEHFQKAQAEGKLVPYANHNPDYQVDLDAIALGTKIGVTSLMAFLAGS
jgi:hippurate hydrolase